jgi:hypothetical protein
MTRKICVWFVCVSLAAASVASAGAAEQRGTADEPPAASFSGGVPVGLYFMTRFTGTSLEKAVWYFAPDGSVYQNLTEGFSAADLAAHKGYKGKAARSGDQVVVTWADGKSTKSNYKATATGFGWNGGIFTPVKPIASAAAIAGSYSGGNSLASGGSWIAGSSALELRADGTYSRGGVGSATSTSGRSQVSSGGTSAASGKWTAGKYSIAFTDESGKTVRQIAFPYDDSDTPITPDHLYIGGTMFKRR